MRMSAFWVGYFELLHKAEIIISSDKDEDDLVIEF